MFSGGMERDPLHKMGYNCRDNDTGRWIKLETRFIKKSHIYYIKFVRCQTKEKKNNPRSSLFSHIFKKGLNYAP